MIPGMPALQVKFLQCMVPLLLFLVISVFMSETTDIGDVGMNFTNSTCQPLDELVTGVNW